MDAGVLCGQSACGFSVSNCKIKLGKPFYSLEEIADVSLHFPSSRLQGFPVLKIRSEGRQRGRSPKRDVAAARRSSKEADSNHKVPQSTGNKLLGTSDQDEIIRLFRRIRTSIARDESDGPKKRGLGSSKDLSSAESLLEVLRQSSRRQDGNLGKEERRTFAQRGVEKKERTIQDSSLAGDFKLTRPPSNFLRKSPIPLQSLHRAADAEMNNEGSSVSMSELASEMETPQVEKMKLPELRALAKSRGLKAYSKLKKSELVELLKP
ncbi:Rho termination factor, N-terminal [Dillenia turbinata]|uniref:Rho termination factor, N-terminal n=1 Tax=Dillenia turbinata TaxID=194707 RepID=A0AAN8VCX8_9MAGN